MWCNGNTEDFGSSISGSNPDTSTTIVNSVFIVYDGIIVFMMGQASSFRQSVPF